MIDLGAQPGDHLPLLVDRASQLRRLGHQRPDRPVQGLVHNPGSAHPVVRQRGQPAADGLHRGGGQQPLGIDGGLGHREQYRIAKAALAHHLSEVRRDLGHRPRRHPVQHDSNRGTPLRGRAQILPGHGVGVSSRRGDEQPQIGGGQQLGRELAVLRHHRVDVRRIEQGQARRDRVVHHQLKGPRGVRGAGGAGQPRQDAVVSEPSSVGGVVDQNRGPGGRPDHTGRGDPPPDQGVHQGRLPGSGGPADHGEQRRIDGGQPGQHVVVELGGDLADRSALLVGPGQRQGKCDRVNRGAEGDQRRFERRHRARVTGHLPPIKQQHVLLLAWGFPARVDL